jgi:hypothetical protein
MPINNDHFVKRKFPLPWWEGMKGRGREYF